LTGNTARYGKWIRNALELAREEHNADPIRKYEISFVIEDDAGEAGKAVTATQKLITADRVPAIFGTWSSAGVLAMAPIIESHKVVLMADAISPRVRTAGDWVFRCVPDASLSLSTLEQPIKGSAFQRLAIVYLNNDFGKDLSDFMTRIIGQGPPAIVLNEGYTSGTTDFRTLIEKIRSTRPDALFIAGYVEQGTLIRQSKEQGLKVQIFASPSFENEDILLQAGNTADGIIFPSYFDTNSEVNIMREFLTKYRGRYDESAEGFGASSYAGIKILFEAIERSQSVDSNGIRQSLY
jgi:branched-chain amino acid transport system substrate-binding protein